MNEYEREVVHFCNLRILSKKGQMMSGTLLAVIGKSRIITLKWGAVRQKDYWCPAIMPSPHFPLDAKEAAEMLVGLELSNCA